MQLPALKLVERREMRVAVVQRNDQTQVHLVIRGVIEKAAALGMLVERPACRVNDEALLVLGGVDFPDFLDADSVVLRV